MNNNTYSIMVIDDHPIIHDGLDILFAKDPHFDITGHAHSAAEAMRKLKKGWPDIAIVDLSMGDLDGTYLIQRIHSKYPKLKMLVYTMSEEILFAERTANAGASGYMMKTSAPGSLKGAIRTIMEGGLYFSPDITAKIERKLNGRNSGSHNIIDTLSNREMDIFKLLGEGLDASAISERFNISRNTVDTHRINIKNKLDLPSGKALERLAYEVIQQGKLPEKGQAGR
jgi:DNA-binding NarL/FixJ family response regulator